MEEKCVMIGRLRNGRDIKAKEENWKEWERWREEEGRKGRLKKDEQIDMRRV